MKRAALLYILIIWNLLIPVSAQDSSATFSVTVPSSLPIHVNQYGEVGVLEDAVILNNSDTTIEVSEITIEPLNDWEQHEFVTDKIGHKQFSLSVSVSEVGVQPSSYTQVSYIAKVSPQRYSIEDTIARVTFIIGRGNEGGLADGLVVDLADGSRHGSAEQLEVEIEGTGAIEGTDPAEKEGYSENETSTENISNDTSITDANTTDVSDGTGSRGDTSYSIEFIRGSIECSSDNIQRNPSNSTTN